MTHNRPDSPPSAAAAPSAPGSTQGGMVETLTGALSPDSEHCTHCNHGWGRHNQLFGDTPRCDCGCMWQRPKPPEPPPPAPTAREQIVDRARVAIYAELTRQHQADEPEIDGAGYWDPEYGCLDGEPDWWKVADAALSVLLDDDADDVARELMTEVGWW